jgi:peptidoglycan/LPS O-acetylase OafA/YrhL
MISKSVKKDFFPALTGIRAIAAFSVFFFHFNPLPKSSFVGGIINELHIGVDIFFVLSGFLIAYRYYDLFQLKRKWIVQYIVNRIARIYPAFFLFTIITYANNIIIAVLDHKFTVFQVLKHNLFELFLNLTFLKGFFYDLKFIGIPQGWTLTVEECFYFSAPLIFFLSKKIKLFLIPLLLLIAGFIIVSLFSNKLPYGFFSDNTFMLMFTFFGKGFEFFVGIWLALQLKKNTITAPRYISLTYTSILGILVLLILISFIRQQSTSSLPAVFIINFILPFFITTLFAGLILEKNSIGKIVSGNTFLLLGKSSYIFYLIHMGIIQLFIAQYLTENIIINFILLNIISIFFFKFFEEPLNHKIRSWYLAH